MNPIKSSGESSGKSPAVSVGSALGKPTGEQPGKDVSDNLPLLTQVVKELPPDELPTLTEVVADSPAVQETPEASTPPPRTFSDEEMQQLLLQLAAHLETVFTIKLNLHLEQLQQQAVEQAVNELKAELPELLRDALNGHLEARQIS